MKIVVFTLASVILLKSSFGQFINYKFVCNSAPELLRTLNSYRSFPIDKINWLGVCPGNEITDSVKKRFLSILNREWTDLEINPQIDKVFQKDFRNLFEAKFWHGIHDSIYLSSMKWRWTFDSTYHFYYDSMAIVYKKEIERSIKNQIVPDEVVLAAACAQIKEVIPILKSDLAQTSNHKFNKPVSELALAKLGDKFYLEQIYKNHKQYLKDSNNFKTHGMKEMDEKNLRFLKSQESFSAIVDWIDTLYKIPATIPMKLNHNWKYVYASSEILYTIFRYIRNKDFQEGFSKLPSRGFFGDGEFEDVTAEQLMYIKNWMKKNKGKYEFQ